MSRHRVIVLKVEETGPRNNDTLLVTMREQSLRPTKGWQWSRKAVTVRRDRKWFRKLNGNCVIPGHLPRRFFA